MYHKDIEKILKSDTVFYAHRKEGISKEILESHLELTFSYYKKMETYKKMQPLVKNILKKTCKNLSESSISQSYELFKAAIYYHDIGKINPCFQAEKMGNPIHSAATLKEDSNHSNLSARIYMDVFLQELQNTKEKYKETDLLCLQYIIVFFGYIISRHHTTLENLNHFAYELEHTQNVKDLFSFQLSGKQYEKITNNDTIEQVLSYLSMKQIPLYILCKVLYSCLVTCDFYATYEYMNEGKQVAFDIPKQQDLFERYENSNIFQNIEAYRLQQKQIEGINQLRSDMFIEVEEKLKQNLDKNIFYLEAPTGAGKTNMAINIARIFYKNIENMQSINYIFPFNTLIEQTDQTFEQYFEKYKDYILINSISPIVKDVNEKLDFEETYLKNVFRQYPMIITSHVNLFDTLFGTKKGSNYTVYDFINSVVILDEIQAYSNQIWREMIILLQEYAQLLNIKIVFMSATLPRLDMLLKDSKVSICNLISDSQHYYQHPLFKNRVELDFTLLEEDLDLDALKNKILAERGKRLLVEFIKKNTAREMYLLLKKENCNVYEITGDDNSYTRKKILYEIKNSTDIIVIATQTIEAGVDIDMDMGWKDISFLDSEEQFVGRVNRSSKNKNCKVYFFDYDDAKQIYKNDYRLEYNLKSKKVQDWFVNKHFFEFYQKVMEKIYSNTEKYNKHHISNLYHHCGKLDYQYISKHMLLIPQNTIQIFLNYPIQIDNTILQGKDIFYQYLNICKDTELSYAEKKVRLSSMSRQYNLFVYTIFVNQNSTIQGEKVGSIYYVDNGQAYIEDGKFNRNKYLDNGEGLFL